MHTLDCESAFTDNRINQKTLCLLHNIMYVFGIWSILASLCWTMRTQKLEIDGPLFIYALWIYFQRNHSRWSITDTRLKSGASFFEQKTQHTYRWGELIVTFENVPQRNLTTFAWSVGFDTCAGEDNRTMPDFIISWLDCGLTYCRLIFFRSIRSTTPWKRVIGQRRP